MATPFNNLFLRLHKWAARQDENFLTESLALTLEHLLVLAPVVGTQLVRQITGGFIDVAPEDASLIQLHPQVEAEKGRPDLEIRATHRLVWVEVKAEAELRTGQLEGYRVLLNQYGDKQTRLVLLTRYRQEFHPEDERPDSQVRWFEVANWFENEVPATDAAGEIAGFLSRQFLDFLGARGMKIAQVGKFMPEGLRALSNMLNMLIEAATACKVSVRKTAGWNHTGIHLDGDKFAVSVNFSEPEKLWFGTRCRVDPEKATKLGIGELEEVKPGYHIWRLGVELDSEHAHFFARSKVSQMEWLEAFVQDCLSKARSITTSDQPLPEESEEE